MWISGTMGHKNAEMIMNVYAKHIEGVRDVEGVSTFAEVLRWTWAREMSKKVSTYVYRNFGKISAKKTANTQKGLRDAS